MFTELLSLWLTSTNTISLECTQPDVRFSDTCVWNGGHAVLPPATVEWQCVSFAEKYFTWTGYGSDLLKHVALGHLSATASGVLLYEVCPGKVWEMRLYWWQTGPWANPEHLGAGRSSSTQSLPKSFRLKNSVLSLPLFDLLAAFETVDQSNGLEHLAGLSGLLRSWVLYVYLLWVLLAVLNSPLTLFSLSSLGNF